MTNSNQIKICFVSLHGYPLYKKNHPGYFGGAEVQLSLIVKELLKDNRFQVSLITGDYGQKNIEKIGRLTLYKCFRKRNLSYFELVRTALIAKIINADWYVGRTAANLLWLMAMFCKFFRKRLIYMVAHDWDCQLSKANPASRVNRRIFIRALSMADLIIAQTKFQQHLLKQNLNFNSIIMPSLSNGNKNSLPVQKKNILWVGRADWWKQPLVFLQLAKKWPGEKFDMVCRQGADKQLYKEVKKTALSLPNVSFFNSMSIDAIGKLFNRAKLFVNTSIAEGFPNTFLQAGCAKTPIFSFKVNPDNFITKYNCGLTDTKNFGKIISNKTKLNQMGYNNYLYVKKFHSVKKVNIFKSAVLKFTQ